MKRSLCIGLIAYSAWALPAHADQKDARLPGLFVQLKQAASPDAAAAVEQNIWGIWTQSGDPAIDKLMDEGSTAMTLSDFETALDRFNAIVAKKPDFAEGWNKRATLYYMMGEYQKSLADIDHVLKLEPRHIGALSGLGMVNLQLDRNEAAADAFQRVLDIDPQNAGAKSNLAIIDDILQRKAI